MSEPAGEYMTLVTEPTAQVVECPSCHVRIGHVIRRNNERWLAVGGLLIPWVPFGLCAACEGPVYFGRKKPIVPPQGVVVTMVVNAV